MAGGQHLILIAVGPVQEFIAASRKLRDLWYGSTLLSELSKSVAAALHAERCELVFPAPANAVKELKQGSALIAANKILAVCPVGVEPAAVVKKAQSVYRAAWLARCREAQDRFPRGLRLNAERFQSQVEDFGEFYAVWVPLEGGYADARGRAENLLAARKAARCFSAPAWDGAGLPKSSLDGVRESVFDAHNTGDTRVKRGEVLDAVGAVKRFGGRPPKFETLSDLATIPWKEGVRALKDGPLALGEFERAVQSVLTEWPDERGTASSVNELLYAHNLADALDRRGLAGTEVERQARQALRPLVEALGEPSAYACLLLGDGDRMGRALDALKDAAAHRTFSLALSAFAAQASEIVARHQGGLVYSGGDDVMACLPLHAALDCADQLRRTFENTMHDAFPEKAEVPTFSVGLVIVHHSDDLGGIRKLAQEAERAAKDRAGRNALCVIQDKRSGGKMTVFGKWEGNGKRQGIVDRLRRLQELYETSGLSSRLGYQLRMVAQSCGAGLKWHADGRPANAAASETLRVMRRKQTADGDLSESYVQEVVRMYDNIRALSDELVIARQLSQARVLARGKQWCAREDD